MISFDKIKELSFALSPVEIGRLNNHFTFIVYKNKIITIANNNHKTHPINLLNPKYNRESINISSEKKTCSELAAIIKFNKTTNIPLNKCYIFNTRISRENKIALARPCQSCNSLLKYFAPKGIFYSNDAGEFCKYELT